MNNTFKTLFAAFILCTAPVAAMQRPSNQSDLAAFLLIASMVTNHHHITHQGTAKTLYFATPVPMIFLCTDHTSTYFRDVQTNVLYSVSCPNPHSGMCLISTLQQAPAGVQPLRTIDFSFVQPQQQPCQVM